MTSADIEEFITRFHWADYLVFGIGLFLSLFVGCLSGAKDWADFKFEKKGALRATSGVTKQLLGGRDLHPVPVAFSLLASLLSAPFLLGIPAEIYTYGSMYAAIILGSIIATPITAHLFVPVLHAQQMTSAYEFIEKRFSRWLRVFGSCLFSAMMMLYLAIVVYAPAVAFAQVTGLPILASILGAGVISTVYTAFGGIKAVVWADAVQMVIIVVGILALIIEGTYDVGGADKVWQTVLEGKRIQTDSVSLDPTVRHTWWSQTIGGLFISLTFTATNQTMIQRYLSIKTTKGAQVSVYLAGGLQVIFTFLILMLACVMYAFYDGCDPILTGRIDSKDQLVPVFVMDSLGNVVGLPGLFSVSVFAASLSTVSSGVNSLAAVTMADIILPLYKMKKMRKMNDIMAAQITKGLSVVFGLLTTGLAFLPSALGPTLIQVALSVFGMVGGPLLALFIMAIFFPFVNEWGAFVGTIGSLIITSWIAIGSIVHPNDPTPLPVSADRCPFNITVPEEKVTEEPGIGIGVTALYNLSYMWYGLLSVIVSLLIGLPTSILTGNNSNPNKNDISLYYPYHRKCRPCFSCCACDSCMYIEDEEEAGEAHVYVPERARQRSSVADVFGIYQEDPTMKRSSIAIQYGPSGSIMGGTIQKIPLHMMGQKSHDLGGITEEEEYSEIHGVSNPGFIDNETIHPAITVPRNSKRKTEDSGIKAKTKL